jgi:hypothetical protein
MKVTGRLHWLAEESGNALAAFLAGSVLAALLSVAALHLLQAAALGSNNAGLAVAVAAVAIGLAGGCVAAFLWAFWQTVRLPEGQAPFGLAAVLAIITIGVCVEAFAGTVALLWQYGVARPANGSHASLWRTEGYYVWHLLDSIPVLTIPETLGWREPATFVDHASGALLLAFKLVVIAPLVRLALSGYRRIENARRQAQREPEGGEQHGPWPPGMPFGRMGPNLEDAWYPSMGLIGALAVGSVALAWLFDPSWWPNRWLADRLDPGVQVRGVHVPLGWVPTVPQWLVVAGLLWVTAVAAGFLLVEPLEQLSSPVGVLGAVLGYVAVLAMLTLTAAATALALLHTGLASADPAIPVGSQPAAAVQSYLAAMAGALPGPDIPSTLNWSVRYRFVDHWTGTVLLLYKIAFVGVLAFPLARIVRAYLDRSGPAVAGAAPPRSSG